MSHPSSPIPNYRYIYRVVARNSQNGSDSIRTELRPNSLGSGISRRHCHLLMSSQDSFYFDWLVDSFIAKWMAEWVDGWMGGWVSGWTHG